MAMIKCPECGRMVSDKASTCPQCGCPVADASPSGTVRIKLGRLTGVMGGNQDATITANGKTLWEGSVGQVAEFYLDRPTTVEVQYHLSLMHYGGSCSALIEPAKGKKYCVVVRQGMFKTIMDLQRVDMIDSD